ncbi:MAG: right-handed parallel beta-helix repeat-containing protein [Myxococcota bacterium]|nr:right-handed parallel beta-helix repeat-containing protein [Myxococcota bacterium]
MTPPLPLSFLLLVTILSLQACSGLSTHSRSARTGILQKFVVSPQGDDGAVGSREQPWRTLSPLSRRLSSPGEGALVELTAGKYDRPLRLNSPTSLIIRSLGPVEVTLEIENSGHKDGKVKIQQLQLTGQIRIKNSSIDIEDSQLTCETGICIRFENTKVLVNRVSFSGAKKVMNLINMSNTEARLQGVRINNGGHQAQILAKENSRLTLSNSEVMASEGIGLSIIGESKAVLENSVLKNAKKFALHVDDSDVEVMSSTVGSTNDIGVGVARGSVQFSRSIVESSKVGSVYAFRSLLSFMNSRVENETGYGLIAEQSHLKGQESFFGQIERGTSSSIDDTLFLTGSETQFFLHKTQIENSRGFGLRVENGAHGVFSGEISNARYGAVWINTKADEGVRIENSKISRVFEGPGVLVSAGEKAVIVNSQIRGCSGGGLLVTVDSSVAVDGAQVTNNGNYDMAAYGTSNISTYSHKELDRAKTFASCGEEAQIEFVSSSPTDEKAKSSLSCP